MANIENRAAEHGGKICVAGPVYEFNASRPAVVLRVVEAATIQLIESPNMENIGWYVGKALPVDAKDILGNITKLQLASGVVQVIYS